MASDLSFVEFVVEQTRDAGHISFKKMFGEYAIYCEGKVVAFVCDNQLFVKPTAAVRALLDGDVAEAPPYPSAKPYFLMDSQLDDAETISRVIQLTARELPVPVPRTPKNSKAKGTPKGTKRA